jgi:hypothetical protein
MPGWIMREAPPRQGRAAALGTAILLLLGIAMGAVLGIGLSKLVDAAQLEELAHEFRSPTAAGSTDLDSLPA